MVSMKVKKFGLIIGAVCLLCVGCGNKEVPVKAMENMYSIESVITVEESGCQMDISGVENQDVLESTEIPVFESMILYTTDQVNCRALNTTESDVVAVLPGNDEVVAVGYADGWYYIQYQDVMGYVREDFLTDEKPVTNGKLVVIDAGHQSKSDTSK